MPEQRAEDLPQPPEGLTEEAEKRSAPHPSVVYEAIITYVIGLGQFAHLIAGSVDKLLLVTTGALPLGGYLGDSSFPRRWATSSAACRSSRR